MILMMLRLVFPAIVVAFVLNRAYTDVDGRFVEEWARAHGLVLSPRNRSMVHWYLRTARILRAWGVLAGLLLPALIDAAFGWRALQQSQPFLAFAGYLVGALYAEVALVRPADGERRVAALVPREIDDYLPRRLVVAQQAVAAAAVVGAAILLLVGFDQGLGGSPPSRASVVLVALVAAVLGLTLERIERWVVQRPQPFTDAELVAADDAIRSQSVHSVAGSGLAMLLLLLGGVLFGFAVTDVPVLRWTMWLPGLVCFLGSIQVCLYYGHRAWRVRRSLPKAAPA
ncbi:MAG: hypothetical protein QOG87_968 [Actinomycetota bacterium]|jgi:hypothetical protein